jgi:hypothetical protein
MKKWEAVTFRWLFTFTTIIAIVFFLIESDLVELLIVIFSMFATGVFWLGKYMGIEKSLK